MSGFEIAAIISASAFAVFCVAAIVLAVMFVFGLLNEYRRDREEKADYRERVFGRWQKWAPATDAPKATTFEQHFRHFTTDEQPK